MKQTLSVITCVAVLAATGLRVVGAETAKAIRFSGVNVQVVNGTNSTDEDVNGLGNLIVGYQELRSNDGVDGTVDTNDRRGSHNLVVGSENNYSIYAGQVVGRHNIISGHLSTVCGGQYNTAEGEKSTVSGGDRNTASGGYSTVSGGVRNSASVYYSAVNGGRDYIADQAAGPQATN